MFRFVPIVDQDVANRLAFPSQDSVWSREAERQVESEVFVSAVSHDVGKPVLRSFGDRFDRLGRFFQNHNHLPQGQSQISEVVTSRPQDNCRKQDSLQSRSKTLS